MRVGILLSLDAQIEKSIHRARELGFASGQISVWDMELYNVVQAEQLKAICTGAHFEISALWCGWSGPVDWSYPGMYTTLGLVPTWLRSRRLEDLLQGAAFGRLLGIRNIITHIGFIPDNPFDENFIGIAEVLRVIGSELKKHDQRLLFETGEELPVTLIQMMRTVGLDNLGVNFDPANLLSNGRSIDPVKSLHLLAPYLLGIHAKDAIPPAGIVPKGHETQIGRGEVNFPAMIGLLREIGYDGEITIEHENVTGEEWERDVAESRVYINGLLAH